MTSPHQSRDWPTFTNILQRLHDEGIYIHHEQLAEFLLYHGLPVDLRYVPPHLQAKAQQINQNYQGDMACMSAMLEEPNFVECYRDLLMANQAQSQ
ncbi:MAG: hypothetical protein ACTS2F_21570 [Thainema sp.]